MQTAAIDPREIPVASPGVSPVEVVSALLGAGRGFVPLEGVVLGVLEAAGVDETEGSEEISGFRDAVGVLDG